MIPLLAGFQGLGGGCEGGGDEGVEDEDTFERIYGAFELFVADRKPQRFDQMQTRTGIYREADRIAGVGRNFRFV